MAALGSGSLAVAGGKIGGDPTIDGTTRALLNDPGNGGDPVGAVPCRDGSWTKNGDAVYQCIAGAWQYVVPGTVMESKPEQDPKKCVFRCWKDEFGAPVCM